MHARGSIRAQLVTLISKTSIPDSQVFSNRATAQEYAHFPSANVSAATEQSEGCRMRELPIDIEIRCISVKASIDDIGDELSEEIENAIASNPIPGVLLYYESMDSSIDSNGEKYVNTITLSYRAKYEINPKNTSEIIGD